MRKFQVNVNGKSFAVEVEEVGGGAAAPVVSAAPTPAAAPAPVKTAPAGGSAVTAPMPGLILKLAVKDGSAVKKNDKLIVLEAMKMENDIVANADGVVTFLVKEGDTVETGAQLASIR